MKMKLILAFLSFFLSSNLVFAESEKDKDMEGFDYNRGKMEGRATIAGRVAVFQITGNTAEAMYYQLSAPAQEDIGCTTGKTKWFHGVSCTKYQFPGNEKYEYECWVNINCRSFDEI